MLAIAFVLIRLSIAVAIICVRLVYIAFIMPIWRPRRRRLVIDVQAAVVRTRRF